MAANWTTGEVSLLLGTSSQTIINWINSGRLAFQRVGKGPRKVSPHDLYNFIQTEKINSNYLHQEMYARLCRETTNISNNVKVEKALKELAEAIPYYKERVDKGLEQYQPVVGELEHIKEILTSGTTRKERQQILEAQL